jgi:hypothetical protein
VEHARRILQERGPDPDVHARLRRLLRTETDVTRRLRALWALYVTEGLREAELMDLLGDPNEYMRSWAVYLLVQNRNAPDAALERFAGMARSDQSALVRLYLASALQRVPVEKRWDVLTGLLTHQEDATDHNLPMMVWYAAEPVIPLDMTRSLELSLESPLPKLFSFAVQRISAVGTQDALRVLTDRLGRTTSTAHQKELANGIVQLVNRR